MASTWIWGFIARSLFFMPTMTLLILNQKANGDEITVVQGIIVSMLLFATLEFYIYLNNESRVHLFYRLKQSEQQQKQLSSLLDIVPDSVFICSKPKKNKQVTPVFSNKKMNDFFGKSIFSRKTSSTGRMQLKSVKVDSKTKQLSAENDPLKMKIFHLYTSQFSAYRQISTHDTFEESYLSLSLIVQQSQQAQTEQIYRVKNPNPYSSDDTIKLVQIKVLDVIFDEDVCNLVYIRDVTKTYREKRHERFLDSMLVANQFCIAELQNNHRTLQYMTQQLLNNSSVKSQGILRAISYGNLLNHLIASNLTEYQLLQSNNFIVKQKVLDEATIQHDVIDVLQSGAQIVDLSLSYDGDQSLVNYNVATDVDRVIKVLQNTIRYAIH